MQLQLFFILCVASIAGLLFGYDTGIIAGALPLIQTEMSLTTWECQLLVSSTLLGALLGSLGSGLLANHMGRRMLIGITAILFTLGALWSSIAPEYHSLILARTIVGIAIGIASYSVPLYISEISPTKHRGSLIAINTIAVTGGIVIAYIASYWLNFYESWRWMLGLGTFPAIFLWIAISFLPESQRWLARTGHFEQAKEVLTQLYTSNNAIQTEYKTIYPHSLKPKFSWKSLGCPQFKSQLILGFVLAGLQQLTGINAILYYAPILLNKIGLVQLSSTLLVTISIGLANFIMTIVALCIVDKMGRRPLLLWGVGLMIVSLMSLGIILKTSLQQDWILGMAILCILSFVSAYALSIGCIFWILIAEIFPLETRNIAMGITSSFNWGANLLISITFLNMLDFFGTSITFWSYGVIGIFGWLYCYYKLPETARYSLEEIEAW